MSAQTMIGGCYCQNLTFTISSNIDPSGFNPRACDCEFCTKHGAAYFSDHEGSLEFQIQDESDLIRYRMGSKTAQVLMCRECGVLVGVVAELDDGIFGAVNSKAVDSSIKWGESTSASPKLLSTDEKIGRWENIWFPEVQIVVATE